MFRHRGKTRNYSHNLKIASLLSFVAGIVNVIGFFAVQRLTTNVTGHFAFFIDEVFKLNFYNGFIFFLFIFFFFAGSFFSNLLIELVSRKNDHYIYIVPATFECAILYITGFFGHLFSPDLTACILLFAMGLQNSLVTSISNSVVRTTHLTGLFTDLGIDLSQLFFYKSSGQRKKLRRSVRLRLFIISFFFLGGIAGGILFTFFKIHGLIFAGIVLTAALLFDNIRYRILLLSRKYI